jgi:hypothetical protein
MCLEGYSPKLPSNFGIFDGSFDDIMGYEGLLKIGSFINHEKYDK